MWQLKENTLKKQYQEKDTLFDDSDEVVLPTALATMSNAAMNVLYHQTKKMMGRIVDYKELRMIYACAMKEIKTKFDILNIPPPRCSRRLPGSWALPPRRP